MEITPLLAKNKKHPIEKTPILVFYFDHFTYLRLQIPF